VLPLVLLVLVTAVWGITFVQVKDALALYPLFAFLAVRFAIASATLAVPGRRTLRSLGRDGWRAGIVLGLLLAAGYAFQTAGLERTTVSSTGFITGLYVVLTPLFGLVLFRTRLGLEVWLGVTLAVVGLAMLSGVHVGSPGGNLLVLASTSAQALQILMVERYAPRYDAIALTLVLFGYVARITRAGVVEALEADYTRTAFLKGLPRKTVIPPVGDARDDVDRLLQLDDIEVVAEDRVLEPELAAAAQMGECAERRLGRDLGHPKGEAVGEVDLLRRRKLA